MTRSLPVFRLFVSVVAMGSMACSAPPGGNSDAGVSLDDVQLMRVDSSPVRMDSQSSRTLRVKATNVQSQPVADVPIEWSFVQTPSSPAQLVGDPLTDATGVATVTVSMANQVEKLMVRASLPNGGAYVEWEIRPREFILRGDPLPPLSVTDSPVNQKVEGNVSRQQEAPLRVQLVELTEAGEVPVSDGKIVFQVSRGVVGTSLPGENPGYYEVTTDADGRATASLTSGATTGVVTVLSTFDNLPPVQFDLTVAVP